MKTVNKHFFSNMGVMLERSMRHIFRSMDTIITVTIMPIAVMLLFVYVLGGAIQTGTDNYVNYLLPGILLIAIANSIGYTCFRLFTDVQRGIFERFHQPIAESFFRWYSGSGLVIHCLARFQRMPSRSSVARMVSSLTRSRVNPSAKLTSATNSRVHDRFDRRKADSFERLTTRCSIVG
jgi:hypothetical protein